LWGKCIDKLSKGAHELRNHHVHQGPAITRLKGFGTKANPTTYAELQTSYALLVPLSG
jgi:hypothetical protein